MSMLAVTAPQSALGLANFRLKSMPAPRIEPTLDGVLITASRVPSVLGLPSVPSALRKNRLG